MSGRNISKSRLITGFFIIGTILMLGCSGFRKSNGNDSVIRPTVDGNKDRDPTPQQPTPEVTPDVSDVKIPEKYSYTLTASDPYGDNPKIYSYTIDQKGDLRFQSFRGPQNTPDKSFETAIVGDDLKRIIYYYDKVDFSALRDDYSVYDAAGCGFNSERGPFLYEITISSGKVSRKIRFREFCSQDYRQISDLFALMRRTEQYAYLREPIFDAINKRRSGR